MSRSEQGLSRRYRIVSPVAMGGMGEVFVAQQEGPAGFSKTVALKRLLPHIAADPTFVRLFLQEARLAARLNHPNIVQIYELGQEEQSYFIAMEYVRGPSLRALLQRAPGNRLPQEVAALIAHQALQGLAHAHRLKDETEGEEGIIHRDVSPENLLLDASGAVKLADFGIAKAVGSAATKTTGVKGKLTYLAPELLLGGAASPQSDLYAVGVVLFEMLSGRCPFVASNEGALVHAVVSQEPPTLGELRVVVHPRLDALVSRAVAKRPDHRFESAEAMRAELERCLEEMKTALSVTKVGALVEAVMGGAGVAKSAEGAKDTLPATAEPARTVALRPPTGPVEAKTIAVHLPPHSRRALRWMGAGAGLVLLTLFAGLGLSRGGGSNASVERGASAEGPVSSTAPAATAPVEREASAESGAPSSTVSAATASVERGASRESGAASSAPSATARVERKAPAESGSGPSTVSSVNAAAGLTARGANEARDAALEPARAKSSPRASSPAARRTPAPKPAMARLRIQVTPWAEVFWRGRSLGITPMEPIQLPAGRQVLVLRNRELNRTREVTVDLRADEQQKLSVDLRDSGSVTFDTRR